MPGLRAGARQLGGIGHVDEADAADSKTARERTCDVDLQPARGDDLPAAYRPHLKPGRRQVERDDEHLHRLAGLRRSGGRGPGDEPEHDDGEHRGSERPEHPQRRHAHHELYTTRTGVPVTANANSRRASNRFTRTQPWDAAYEGTYEYSWNAMPPVK